MTLAKLFIIRFWWRDMFWKAKVLYFQDRTTPKLFNLWNKDFKARSVFFLLVILNGRVNWDPCWQVIARMPREGCHTGAGLLCHRLRRRKKILRICELLQEHFFDRNPWKNERKSYVNGLGFQKFSGLRPLPAAPALRAARPLSLLLLLCTSATVYQCTDLKVTPLVGKSEKI